MNNFHIVPIQNGWALRPERNGTTITTAETKAQILIRTAELLDGKQASVKIHLQDGKFEEERTYPRSSDPVRSKG